jgi:RimJ/RimL family protein N-acetyltransferase
LSSKRGTSVEPLPPADRGVLRALLDSYRVADAIAFYYALEHPESKTNLWVHRAPSGLLDGFLVRARTGQDLFRPLVTLRARDPSSAAELIHTAFPAPAPAIFSLPEPLGLWVMPLLTLETTTRLLLYRLSPARFEPVINILVRGSLSPDGLPRFEIRREDRLLAAAGVNWRSSDWAEIFVFTDAESRERGFGRSVCAALCQALLQEKRGVIYSVEEDNPASVRLAQSVGFEDTGEREFVCAGSIQDTQFPPGDGSSAPPPVPG